MQKLLPGEVAKLQAILTKGVNNMTYNLVANFLIPRGYGWAQASGVARHLVPNFVPIDFAKHWYKPYQINSQTKSAFDRGFDVLIPEKNMINKPLKENTRYMYNVSFTISDSEGNVIGTKEAAYYDDERLTPEDIGYRAGSVFADESESVPVGSSDFIFTSQYHNEGWDY